MERVLEAKADLDLRAGVQAWMIHELRRTFRTNLGRLKVFAHIGERLVNKITVQTNVEAIYDRWAYLDVMLDALERTERFVMDVVASYASTTLQKH